MARDDESQDERVRRRVARTLANVVLVLGILAGLGFWASFGFYRLNPGEAAILLRLGKYRTTETREGLRWHLPPPIETREIVNVGQIFRQEFGSPPQAGQQRSAAEVSEAAMQTGDNNIVDLEFVVQYKVGKAFEARYRIGDLQQTLRDSAQAAMREVVGRNSIDDVLSEKRGEVEGETLELLQEILDRYDSGLFVLSVQLQEVQPPAEVRDAFDDVIAAAQDRNRAINEAEGYANEVLPQALAEATELRERAAGYRDATIAEARGEAERFRSVVTEYEKAPDITRRRMYIETMEKVLPGVEKIVIEPGTAQVLPYLPLGQLRGEGARQ